MIRPLRQRHRVIVCTLGVLLPVAFAAGLMARKSVPVAASLPLELAGQENDFGKVIWTKADIWPGQRIITGLRQDSTGSVAVELMIRDLAKPDVLVYWAPGKEASVGGLPDNARLLGALSNRSPLPIPADVRGESGRILLYSLADHELVAASKSFVVEGY
jgi:hypothetical protein